MTTTQQIVTIKGQVFIAENYLLSAIPTLTELYMRTAARPRYKESVQPCHRCKDVLPDTGKAWRYARINNCFYYAYQNIPDKAPALYRSQLPSLHELLSLAKETSKALPATSQGGLQEFIQANYSEYLHAYGDCTKRQQEDLAKACAIVEYALQKIKASSYDIRKNTLFIELADTIQAEDYAYIPHNFRRLKEKVIEVLNGKAIIEAIKLPRADNKNAAQYEDSEVESWVYQLRGMGKNYTNMFIIRKITEMCMLSEKPAPSERWVGTIMQKHEVRYLTAAERFGEKNSISNMYKGYVPMANALFAGDCWQMDATRFNIIGHKTEDKTIRHLFIVVVRDVHSGDILGYDFDYQENRWVYTNALAMAVKTAEYLPYQLIMDRFPGHNTEEFKGVIDGLEARKVKVSIGHKTTAKQRLERHFSTMQTVFMQDSDYYYGEGIKSRRRYAHRSEQYLAALRKRANAEGFDYDKAINEASLIVEQYRDTALNTYSRKYKGIAKSPRQLHQDSEKPNVIHADQKTFAYLFGLKKVLPIKNEGLIITEIFKQEFIYRTTDFNVIQKYKEVLVCYDLEDLSFCHLYENNNQALKPYLGTASEVIRAQGFGPDAQWGEVNRQQAIIASIAQQRKEALLGKKVAGSDIVTLLTPGYSSKEMYIAAENDYLESNAVMSVIKKSGSNEIAADDCDDDYRDTY